MPEQGLTDDGERLLLDLCRDIDASSPLSVIRPTQAWDVGHTPLVDVHHTVCQSTETQKAQSVELFFLVV